MKNNFKAVEFMRQVREKNGEQHALHPELLDAELEAIRAQFKHLIKTKQRSKTNNPT